MMNVATLNSLEEISDLILSLVIKSNFAPSLRAFENNKKAQRAKNTLIISGNKPADTYQSFSFSNVFDSKPIALTNTKAAKRNSIILVTRSALLKFNFSTLLPPFLS